MHRVSDLDSHSGVGHTILQGGRGTVKLGILVPDDEHRHASAVLAGVPNLLPD